MLFRRLEPLDFRLAASLGERELAEVVYLASQHLHTRRASVKSPQARKKDSAAADSLDNSTVESSGVALFGEQEGRIARANIGRDPLYFFAALQRQLGYPSVPRSANVDHDSTKLPPFLEARLNKIEQRLKITEMEVKGGIDLTRFYKQPDGDAPKFDRFDLPAQRVRKLVLLFPFLQSTALHRFCFLESSLDIMSDQVEASIYDYPKYYDLLFGSDVAAEFKFLKAVLQNTPAAK